MEKISKKALTLLFVFSLVISTFIKVTSVSHNNFAFTIDQGRDLVDVRHMVSLVSPRLVGPTTSINGLLLGPFYYYFISVPFILFGGSPSAIVYWQIAWFQAAVIFLWFVLRRKQFVLSNLTGIFLLLSPTGFYTARYFWNANTMPIFTIIFVAALIQALKKQEIKWLWFLGIVSGISLQIEAAFGILFLPISILVLIYYRFSFKKLVHTTATFLLTLIPQLLFEVRHGFMMTKTMIAGLSGSSSVLGEKMIFSVRATNRVSLFYNAIRESNHIPFTSLTIFFLVLFVCFIFLKNKDVKNSLSGILFAVSTFSLISYFIFYLIFSQEIKSWYVLSLPLFYSLLLGTFASIAWKQKIFGRVLVSGALILSFYHVMLAHSDYLLKIKKHPSTDPSNLANQLKAIDWTYKQSNGKDFKVYVYLPSIYDFTYQYLFWWYGIKIYGYVPSDNAYLPNQPEYIEDMTLFHKPNSADSSNLTYLIIEHGNLPDYEELWRNNFSKCQVTNKENIQAQLEVVELKDCL